jgi:hypothetical protein
MTKVTILPELTNAHEMAYRAIAGKQQSVGQTAGEALDALTTLLPKDETGTLVIVQNQRPDSFFSAEQQQRLKTLMGRWRSKRDAGTSLTLDEQAELEQLTEDEIRATTERAKALLRELKT